MSFFEFPHTRTYDSDLGWLIKSVHTHDEALKALDEWSEKAEIRIEDLETFKDALENGDLPEGVRSGILKWCENNLLDLVAQTLKTVFFGLTDDGYFVAYISDSWDDIEFNTSGLDINIPDLDFGHLILSY